MDYLFLKLWHKKTSRQLLNYRLNKVWFKRNMYYLVFGEKIFHIFLHAGDPIIFLSEDKNVEAGQNGLTRICNEHLSNAKLIDIDLAQNDKIITLHFSKKDMFNNHNHYELVIELINRYENLILSERKGESQTKILAVHRNVGVEDSRFRQILPGQMYAPPPELKDPFIFDLCKEEYDKLVGETLNYSWLEFIKHFSNMPKFLKKHYKQAKPSIKFWGKVESIKEKINKDSDLSPKIYFNYKTKLFSLFETENSKEFSDINSAFQFYYDYKIMGERKRKIKQAVVKRLQNKKATLVEKIKLDEKRLAELKQASKWKKFGELLKTNLHKIRRGQKVVKVTDYYDPDQAKIEIPLNPEWNPQKNMQKYFKKFKKAESGRGKLSQHIEKSKKELEQIKHKIDKAKNTTSTKSLRNKQDKLFQQQQKSKKQHKKKKFRRFVVRQKNKEWRIYVGRTSKENDELTVHFANSEDWFFHSRIYHGSHVIVKNDEKRESLPQKILRVAASTAAYFSKAKHSAKVPVDYTKVKYVRKPSKSAPGFVTYTHQKTVFVPPINPRDSQSIDRD